MRRAVTVAVAVMVVGSGSSWASDPDYLIRVDRNSRDDVAILRSADLPVVMETNPCLLLMGGGEHLEWLEANGYAFEVVDRRPGLWDYLLVGLRPDSARDAVEALGDVLLAEENWVLLRVAPTFDRAALTEATVFVTRVPREPMSFPRAAGPTIPSRGVGATETDPLVQKIVDAVNDAEIDRVWQDLTSNPPTGTRYSTAQGCEDAAEYCLDTYGALGIPAEYHDYSPSHAPNVVGTITGVVNPDDVYIVIGHLDDLPSSGPAPGADDNASGSVNVLESARVMSCYSFKNTVRFLNVTGEELGLLGSEAWAADAEARGENILGVINLDMPGWEGDGSPDPENLDLDYNTISEPLAVHFADSATRYGTGLSVDLIYCPSLSASDHWPFWRRGWSAIVGITDNEGYCGHGGNYPYYHTSNDTIANCGDPSFFYSVVRTSVAALAELAEPFKVTFHQPAYSCDGLVQIHVGDRDLNQDPGVQEQVDVLVWSDTEPSPETVTLVEEDVDSPVFVGTVPTTASPPVAGDGFLSVSPGDTVTSEYTDALDCDGAIDVSHTDTASVDCTQPLISEVETLDVTDTEATVRWQTNEASSSEVVWGDSIPPDETTFGEPLVTLHDVRLTGLQSCTVYYYEVRSADTAGNTAVDDNGGLFHHFETLGDFGEGLQSCHAGSLRLTRETFSCDDALEAEVTDIDLNLSPTEADSVQVTVTSGTESDPETLTLVETGPNTSRFRGSLPTGSGPPTPGDGILQAEHGDYLTATYRDEDDGTGSAAVSFDTGAADCSGAAFQSVEVISLTDESAEVRVTTSEATTVTVFWGSTPALGDSVSDAALATVHTLSLAPLAECERFYFRVETTDAWGNAAVFDADGDPLEFNAYEIPGAIFKDGFEGPAAWTLEGEWEIAEPQGLGTSPGDPSSAFSGTNVLGHDLSGQGTYSGDYEPQTTERAISPVIDASALTNGELRFRRRLNTGLNAIPSIEVLDGSTWVTVWSGGSFGQTESEWSLQRVDASEYADGNGALQIAFKQRGGLQASSHDAGWNVDRFIVRDGSLPDFDACGSCAGVPSFAGVGSADDADPCADTGITLGWVDAPAWGTGHAGSYAVYRDTSPDFVPSPANRVAAGIAATTWTDGSAPDDVTLFYIVRAENDETCSDGPANGGLTDGNGVVASARDETEQPPPGDVGSSLRVRPVNAAHVHLSWVPSPDAAAYRIYRAASPDGPFDVLADVGGASFDDLDELGTATSWYYEVRTLDACGNVGP